MAREKAKSAETYGSRSRCNRSLHGKGRIRRQSRHHHSRHQKRTCKCWSIRQAVARQVEGLAAARAMLVVVQTAEVMMVAQMAASMAAVAARMAVGGRVVESMAVEEMEVEAAKAEVAVLLAVVTA